MKMILTVMGGVVDPTAKGAGLFNNLFTGREVTANNFCKTKLGCELSSPTQSAMLNIQLQQDQDKQLALLPLRDRLFSISVPNSLINNLIIQAPANNKPSAIMASVFGDIGKLPESILSAFSPKTQAFSLQDAGTVTGVGQYFISDSDLDSDVSAEVRTEPDGSVSCPATKPIDQVNLCDADSTVIQGLSCWAGATCPQYSE